MAYKATNANFIVFGVMRSGSNSRSTAIEAITLTITPPMWFHLRWYHSNHTLQVKFYLPV